MKYLITIIIYFCFPICSFSLSPKDITDQKENEKMRQNVVMLTIAINDFNHDGLGHLECIYNAKTFIEPLESSFSNNYKKASFIHSYDNEQNTSTQIQSLFDEWKTSALDGNPVRNLAILYLSSHGNVKDSTYYFMTKDSSISGIDIFEHIKYLADAGVIVLVFIDTCHGDALYTKHFKNYACKHREGGVAFYASSSADNSAYMINKNSLFTSSIGYCLSGQDASSIGDQGILVTSLASFINRYIADASKNNNYLNQDPQTHVLEKPLVILKKCSFPYHLQFAAFNPFSRIPDLSRYHRFAESNARAKTYSTILHGVEIVSIIGAATSIGIIASQRSKINDLDDRGLDSNKNRKTARTACYCLYGSAAVFALAYGLQVVNIHHQFKKKHIADTFESIEKGYKDNYVSSVSFGPIVSDNYFGVGLTYEF